MFKKNPVFFLFIVYLLMCTGCKQDSKITSLKEEKLFTMQYGMFEDELRMFDVNSPGTVQASLYMEDGIFYIENSEAKKIMVLTSYGDLVQVFYNKAFNPEPSFVQKIVSTTSSYTDSTTEIVTQKAIEYPFTNVGMITADNYKNLYVVDFLPPERFKEQDSVILRQVVLRFKADGTFIDYLGQEGPGGTPFPYIENIYTTHNNELVVVCRSSNGFCVYWYTSEGFLKYIVPIDEAKLPQIDTEEHIEQYISLANIIPHSKEEKIYLKIDYQISEVDESSKVQSGIVLKETALYPLTIPSGVYEDPLIIPPFEEVETDGYTKTVHKLSYDFLGITDSGWFFFKIGDSTGYSVLMVQPNGQRVLSRHLDIDPKKTLYQSFSLSRGGIISALIIEEKEAKVCWWRTDAVIASFLQ